VRAAAAIAPLLAVAPAASAERVARRTAAAGPALAGDAVVWGEQESDGAVRIVRGAPGAVRPRRRGHQRVMGRPGRIVLRAL
jgi:uncharacterized 2Fe-2S/4Fe-4S cluster protein (DUF4445 family)